MAENTNPEVGRYVRTGDLNTNYHDVGSGAPLLLIHGSGPGVSAFANWRLVMPLLAERVRVLAPDMAGFGYTEIPDGQEFSREVWLRQLVDFLDAVGVDKVSVVGNSFGGSMALALAIHHPERVEKVILMGAVGVPFEITKGLDDVWGYEPSPELMGRLMRETFAYDASMITEEMVQGRYTASLRTQDSFGRMFPAPRQRWVDSMAFSEAEVRGITAPTLLVHGRDDQVIPLSTSLTMLEWIDDAQLHVFGRCGHWTQIEYAKPFARLVLDFLTHDAHE
nr:alpha/beta fold hydrolase [Propionibacterium sp.]